MDLPSNYQGDKPKRTLLYVSVLAWFLTIAVIGVLTFKILQIDQEMIDIRVENTDLASRMSDIAMRMRTVDELSQDVEMLGGSIQNQVSDLQARMTQINEVVSNNSNGRNQVVFDISKSTGYYRIDSNLGIFYVGITHVEKYLEGYKVKVRIGNPQQCSYGSANIQLGWGKPPIDSGDEATNVSNLMNLEKASIKLPGSIKSGIWNEFEIQLTPMTEEDLHYVTMSLVLDGITLNGNSLLSW